MMTGAALLGMSSFLPQWAQTMLGFSPRGAGISFLPMTAALFSVSRLSPRLLARFGARPLMLAGLLPVVAGMGWLSRISPGTGYLSGGLRPMLLIGGGVGVVFVPLTQASLGRLGPPDPRAPSRTVDRS